jgi:hypothetical protein
MKPSYLDHLKEEKKQNFKSIAKSYAKPKQFEVEDHHKPFLDSDTTLNASQVEKLFWSKLVHIGWRINHYNPPLEKGDSYQLMLVCPDCDKVIDTQQSHTITRSKINAMTDQVLVLRKTSRHKETNKGCVPKEYDENGDAVSKVSLEAILDVKLS